MKVYVVMRQRQHEHGADRHKEIHNMWLEWDEALCELRYAPTAKSNDGYMFWIEEWTAK